MVEDLCSKPPVLLWCLWLVKAKVRLPMLVYDHYITAADVKRVPIGDIPLTHIDTDINAALNRPANKNTLWRIPVPTTLYNYFVES